MLHAGAKVLGSLIPFSEWIHPGTLKGLALGSLDGSAVLGLLGALIIALAYGTVAGLRGVVWTDLLQFSLAMIGAIAGLDGISSRRKRRGGGKPPDPKPSRHAHQRPPNLSALAPMDPTWLDHLSPQHPSLDLIGAHGDLVLTALLLARWANKNADGGGVLVQRMLACRSPKDATLAMGWFTAAHYMIRPWAWVATGLVVGLLFSIPPATGFEQSYPDAMLSWLPNGVLGLALGGLVAALISTADTHLHWGASYLANDLLPARQ